MLHLGFERALNYQYTQLSEFIQHIRYAFQLVLNHHLPLAINLVMANSWFH